MAFYVMLAAVMGAAIAWFGTFHVQHLMYRRVNRTDQLRRAFYDYLTLAADYWYGQSGDPDARRALEGRMIVAERVISSEFSLLAKKYPKINRVYVDTADLRRNLWDAASGGCFQQERWEPDPDRVRLAATAVVAIVKRLT